MSSILIAHSNSTSTNLTPLSTQQNQDDQKVAAISTVATTTITSQQEELKSQGESTRSSAEDNLKLYKKMFLNRKSTLKGRDIFRSITLYYSLPNQTSIFGNSSCYELLGTNEQNNINKDDLRMVVNKTSTVDFNKIPCPQALYDKIIAFDKKGFFEKRQLNCDKFKNDKSLAAYYKLYLKLATGCKIEESQLDKIKVQNVTVLLPAKEDGSANFIFRMKSGSNYSFIDTFNHEGNNRGWAMFTSNANVKFGNGEQLTNDWKCIDAR